MYIHLQLTRNAEHGTQNTERGTRNAEHGTQNAERGTQNTERTSTSSSAILQNVRDFRQRYTVYSTAYLHYQA